MRTESQSTITLVMRLNQVIEQRKALEKQEKDLKSQVKEVMGMNATLEAGDFMVFVEDRTRSDLDKAALAQDFGTEVLAKYMKSSHYEILTVKSTVRSLAAIKEVV
jgi:uncharacterized protein (UPF0335 family)